MVTQKDLKSSRRDASDFLSVLVEDAWKRVRSGYYRFEGSSPGIRRSLVSSILECKHAPIIAEIKPVSPSLGRLRSLDDVAKVAREMEAGGASCISVLTEPKHFGGSLRALVEVKREVSIPVLMKDIFVDPIQVEAASRLGADAILLIRSAFESDYSLERMIRLAHSRGLEVLLEVKSPEEFREAVRTEADLVGVNNRDLRTMEVDLQRTRSILEAEDPRGKIVVSESGIRSAEDVRFLWECGARAFLVGSAIMSAENVKEKVRELVMAI